MFLLKLFKNRAINFSRHSNNFNGIRLVAALLVIIAHSSSLLGLGYSSIDPTKFLFGIGMGRFGVLTFFIISGFLITKSWENKKNTVDFALARILRIYPAAIVVVLLSALVLGPLLTNLPLTVYFNHETTHLYLEDVTLYRMYYYLPGVFETNPMSSINGSLWTLPYEFTCYVFLGSIGLLKLMNKKRFIITFILLLFLLKFFFITEINQIIIPIIGIDFKTFFPLFIYFMAGSLFYVLRNEIKLNLGASLFFTLLIYCCKEYPITEYLTPIAFTYILMTIAFAGPSTFNTIGKYGDFSYGLYLYAFPVQQLIIYFLPPQIPLLLMMFLSVVLTFPLAYFSWFLIEKPANKLRYKFAEFSITNPKT